MIVLAVHTERQLEAITARPVHGVLLSGPEGSGKLYTAHHLASRLLGVNPDKLQNYPYLKVISPEKGSTSIDQIRLLQKFLQLKTTGTSDIRRVAIIHDAHTMTSEAQNALLKALEEPPEDTVFILTAPQTLQLKETIYSRVRKVAVLPPGKSQLFEFFANESDEVRMTKAYMMSSGYPGLFAALLRDEEHHLTHAIQQAKALLTANACERLLQVDELSRQKDMLPTLLEAFKLIASTALSQAAVKGNKNEIKRWHSSLASFNKSQAALRHNPNTKLLLTDLFLSV